MLPDRAKLRAQALHMRENEFIAICGRHGETNYDTHYGHCKLCNLELADRPAKIRARFSGAVIFVDKCEIHGLVDHSLGKSTTRTFGKVRCLSCFDMHGRVRSLNANPRRKAARAARLPTYLDFCFDCAGDRTYSVTHGLCLECFTTAGTRRRQPTTALDGPRVLARRSEASTYLATCPAHGAVPHSTIRGLCLTCFNSLGGVRRGPAMPVNAARAAARRAGASSYLEPCPAHGAVPHSVIFGKCLSCFTTAGTKRKLLSLRLPG